MPLFSRSRIRAVSLLLAAAFVCAATVVSASPSDAPFIAANNAAMTKMMSAMDVKSTGNADKDFVATMVPHHQGAIDMSIAILRYGHNEQLKRLAEEIIVTQQQEIAAMRLAVGEPLPPSAPAPDQPSPMSSFAPRTSP
jgi:Domain of unknown function (DUF305)